MMATKGWVAFWSAIIVGNVWNAAGQWISGALWLIFAATIFFIELRYRSNAAQDDVQAKEKP